MFRFPPQSRFRDRSRFRARFRCLFARFQSPGGDGEEHGREDGRFYGWGQGLQRETGVIRAIAAIRTWFFVFSPAFYCNVRSVDARATI